MEKIGMGSDEIDVHKTIREARKSIRLYDRKKQGANLEDFEIVKMIG